MYEAVRTFCLEIYLFSVSYAVTDVFVDCGLKQCVPLTVHSLPSSIARVCRDHFVDVKSFSILSTNVTGSSQTHYKDFVDLVARTGQAPRDRPASDEAVVLYTWMD